MGKGKGWSNDDHNKARKSGVLAEESQVASEWKRSQQEPYDPKQEKVMAVVGSVTLDRGGRTAVYAELVSYKGTGPLRVQLIKRGVNHDGQDFETGNLGKIFPENVLKLAELMSLAVKEIGRINSPA